MMRRRVIIAGLFIACVVAIWVNNNPNPEPKNDIESLKRRMLRAVADVLAVTQNCHFATNRGRRSYQEDRLTCDLHLTIPPSSGSNGPKETRVGAVAVFDGHIGPDTSVMASRLFFDLFRRNLNSTTTKQSSNYMELLKSSLVHTIEDIDAEFYTYAVKHELYSGSTAVVALIYNNHVLVANVGDSKAFLCSQRMHSHEDGQGAASLVSLLAKELTRDHNALRVDEKARVEASGGIFTISTAVPLLMGHFPMTRAIGDVPLKRYGIIATPEVTGWLSLTAKDKFLVVASDGIFESFTPQEVCEFLNQVEDHSDPSLLAQQLVEKAFSEGSTDNLSVVLVPLGSEDDLL